MVERLNRPKRTRVSLCCGAPTSWYWTLSRLPPICGLPSKRVNWTSRLKHLRMRRMRAAGRVWTFPPPSIWQLALEWTRSAHHLLHPQVTGSTASRTQSAVYCMHMPSQKINLACRAPALWESWLCGKWLHQT